MDSSLVHIYILQIRHWIPKRKKKQKVGEMRKTTPKHNMLP